MYSQNQQKLERAKAQVKEIKDFYSHLITYCIMVPIFFVINYYTTSFPWAIFPTVGWGIGILSHAAQTFRWNPFFGRDWEKRKIEELIRKDEF